MGHGFCEPGLAEQNLTPLRTPPQHSLHMALIALIGVVPAPAAGLHPIRNGQSGHDKLWHSRTRARCPPMHLRHSALMALSGLSLKLAGGLVAIFDDPIQVLWL